jgi:UDP-N-acetylmuramoyl-L-alanyl-D-glutamate--2,6-diaminopimelate ligase
VKLVELLSVLPDSSFPSSANDLEIAGISADSRAVRPGEIFVAVPGEHADGWDHAGEAVARGAAAVVSDRPAPEGLTVPWVRVNSPRRALARLSARLAGDPAEKLVLAGVTGTNGKTTTAMLLESILARRYGRSGLVGTVFYRTGRRELPAPQTTPEAPVLQELLAEMVDSGVPAAAMEVSSHALALDRVEGCRFDVTVFTNLTRDHLDFHGDIDSYFDAKKRLFDELRKPGAAAVVNVDDPAGRRLSREVGPPVRTWSVEGTAGADVRAKDVRCDLSGTSLVVCHGGGSFPVSSALVGRFNADNLLGAAAAGLALGIAEAEIAEGIAAVTRVPGRLERVEAGQPYAILVDYAHTEDALKRLLEAVRDLTDKKIVLVFGCGGDRDRGKRAPMGRIAGSLSDIAIATSDNPRSEDPDAILAEVEKGLALSGATKYLKVPDRREAIRTAIDLANPGTVVVIAGKGHERVQIIGDRQIPFDDREVAAEYASRR